MRCSSWSHASRDQWRPQQSDLTVVFLFSGVSCIQKEEFDMEYWIFICCHISRAAGVCFCNFHTMSHKNLFQGQSFFLPFFLPSIHLSIHPSIYSSSLYHSIYHPSIHPSLLYDFMRPSIIYSSIITLQMDVWHPSIRPSSIHPSIRLHSVHPFIIRPIFLTPSILPSYLPSILPSIHLHSVRLFIILPTFITPSIHTSRHPLLLYLSIYYFFFFYHSMDGWMCGIHPSILPLSLYPSIILPSFVCFPSFPSP